MIVIDDKYAIETDSFGNYSLFRRKTVKTGKKAGEESRDYIGHFSSLKNAVKTYVRDRFNSETQDVEISLADAVKRLEAIPLDMDEKLSDAMNAGLEIETDPAEIAKRETEENGNTEELVVEAESSEV